jgi:hypothetical protein
MIRFAIGTVVNITSMICIARNDAGNARQMNWKKMTVQTSTMIRDTRDGCVKVGFKATARIGRVVGRLLNWSSCADWASTCP